MTFLGGTAAYLWGLVQTWTGRANNAWGSSRVWNSGTSWESAYNSEVTSYNTSQANLATMTTNYNDEVTLYNNEVAAYNSVLPPAVVPHIAASGPIPSGSTGFVSVASVQPDRNGSWVVVGWMTSGSTFTGVQFKKNGVLISNNIGAFNSPVNNGSPSAAAWFFGSFTTADTITVEGYQGGGTGATVGIDMWFCSTQANPH